MPKLELRGILAATDSKGRLQLMLESGPAGASGEGYSLASLKRLAPKALPRGYRLPYKEDKRGTDGVSGVATICLPPRLADHWRSVAAELRGRHVRAEVTTRSFAFVNKQSARVSGFSLQLSYLKADEGASPASSAGRGGPR